MALKAVHVSDVPSLLDHVPENPSLSSLCTSRLPQGVEVGNGGGGLKTSPKLMVIGHRGHGMNNSSDPRMKAFKENTILSFNSAANYPLDFVEFDVQVTKDDYPVIFHDDFILSQENGTIYEKRVTDLSLAEFLSYGPQKASGMTGKSLLRKVNGKISGWDVGADDYSCTLQEAFQQVNPCVGFNIELKFDDYIVYQTDHLIHVIEVVLKVVLEHAKGRPIIFSTFQPDAALLVKKLQSNYPVFFLTDGGTSLYYDIRRNSLEEAIKLCLEGGLDGIVSEVKGVFRNPSAVSKIKESKLSLLTYGKLNNVPEAVYVQYLMGIDGVIVDLVKEITTSVFEMITKPLAGCEEMQDNKKPQFSQIELSFMLKLIPQLIQPTN